MTGRERVYAGSWASPAVTSPALVAGVPPENVVALGGRGLHR